jgi:hypothetical protein
MVREIEEPISRFSNHHTLCAYITNCHSWVENSVLRSHLSLQSRTFVNSKVEDESRFKKWRDQADGVFQ